DGESVTRDRLAIDANVGEVPLRDPLRVDAARAGDALQDLLDLLADALNGVEVGPQDLDANGSLDTREQHIQPVSNGLRPDVRKSWKLQHRVHVGLQLLER